MANRSVIIDVGVKLDLDKRLNELENQLTAIEDIGKNAKLTKPLQNQLENVKKEMQEIRNLIDGFGDSKIDATAFEKFQKQIEDKIKKINGKMKDFSDQLSQVQNSISSITGGNFNKMLESWNDKFKDAASNIRQMYDGLSNLMKLASRQGFDFGFSDSVDSAKQNTAELKKQIEYYEQIKRLAATTGRWKSQKYKSSNFGEYDDVIDEKGFSEKISSNLKDANKQIAEALRQYYATEKEYNKAVQDMANGIISQEDLNKIELKFVEISRTFSGMAVLFDGMFKDAFSDMGLEDTLKGIDDFLDEIINKSKTKIKALEIKIASNPKEDVSHIVSDVEKEVSEFKLRKGKIIVPVVLSENDIDKLYDKAVEVIDIVNKKIEDKPIEVNVAYVSGFNSKKRKELLDQMNEQINALEDGATKTELQNIYENLANRALKDLSIEIKTNMSETEESLKQSIKNIHDALEEKPFEINPEVKITEDNRKKLEEEIDKFSKSVSFDVVDHATKMAETITKALTPDGIKDWLDALNNGLDQLTNNLNALRTLIGNNETDNNQDAVQAKENELALKNIQMSIGHLIENVSNTLKDTPVQVDIIPDFKPENFIQQIQNKLSNLSVQVNAIGGWGGGNVTTAIPAYAIGYQSQDPAAAVAIFNDIRNDVDQLAKSEHGFDQRFQDTIKALNSIVNKYQDYWKSGGRKSFYELGGNDVDVSEKLAQYYEKLLSLEQSSIDSAIATQSTGANQEVVGAINETIKESSKKVAAKVIKKADDEVTRSLLEVETEKHGIYTSIVSELTDQFLKEFFKNIRNEASQALSMDKPPSFDKYLEDSSIDENSLIKKAVLNATGSKGTYIPKLIKSPDLVSAIVSLISDQLSSLPKESYSNDNSIKDELVKKINDFVDSKDFHTSLIDYIASQVDLRSINIDTYIKEGLSQDKTYADDSEFVIKKAIDSARVFLEQDENLMFSQTLAEDITDMAFKYAESIRQVLNTMLKENARGWSHIITEIIPSSKEVIGLFEVDAKTKKKAQENISKLIKTLDINDIILRILKSPDADPENIISDVILERAGEDVFNAFSNKDDIPNYIKEFLKQVSNIIFDSIKDSLPQMERVIKESVKITSGSMYESASQLLSSGMINGTNVDSLSYAASKYSTKKILTNGKYANGSIQYESPNNNVLEKFIPLINNDFELLNNLLKIKEVYEEELKIIEIRGYEPDSADADRVNSLKTKISGISNIFEFVHKNIDSISALMTKIEPLVNDTKEYEKIVAQREEGYRKLESIGTQSSGETDQNVLQNLKKQENEIVNDLVLIEEIIKITDRIKNRGITALSLSSKSLTDFKSQKFESIDVVIGDLVQWMLNEYIPTRIISEAKRVSVKDEVKKVSSASGDIAINKNSKMNKKINAEAALITSVFGTKELKSGGSSSQFIQNLDLEGMLYEIVSNNMQYSTSFIKDRIKDSIALAFSKSSNHKDINSLDLGKELQPAFEELTERIYSYIIMELDYISSQVKRTNLPKTEFAEDKVSGKLRNERRSGKSVINKNERYSAYLELNGEEPYIYARSGATGQYIPYSKTRAEQLFPEDSKLEEQRLSFIKANQKGIDGIERARRQYAQALKDGVTKLEEYLAGQNMFFVDGSVKKLDPNKDREKISKLVESINSRLEKEFQQMADTAEETVDHSDERWGQISQIAENTLDISKVLDSMSETTMTSGSQIEEAFEETAHEATEIAEDTKVLSESIEETIDHITDYSAMTDKELKKAFIALSQDDRSNSLQGNKIERELISRGIQVKDYSGTNFGNTFKKIAKRDQEVIEEYAQTLSRNISSMESDTTVASVSIDEIARSTLSMSGIIDKAEESTKTVTPSMQVVSQNVEILESKSKEVVNGFVEMNDATKEAVKWIKKLATMDLADINATYRNSEGNEIAENLYGIAHNIKGGTGLSRGKDPYEVFGNFLSVAGVDIDKAFQIAKVSKETFERIPPTKRPEPEDALLGYARKPNSNTLLGTARPEQTTTQSINTTIDSIEGIVEKLAKEFVEQFSEALTVALNNADFKINIDSIFGSQDKIANIKNGFNEILQLWSKAETQMYETGSIIAERGMLFNNKTGYTTNPFLYSQESKVQRELIDKMFRQARGDKQQVNSFIHSHPKGDATFSGGDFEFMSDLKSQKIYDQYVMAGGNIAHLNTKNISKKVLKNLSDQWNDEMSKMFESYLESTPIKIDSDQLYKFISKKGVNSKALKDAFKKSKFDGTNFGDLEKAFNDYLSKGQPESALTDEGLSKIKEAAKKNLDFIKSSLLDFYIENYSNTPEFIKMFSDASNEAIRNLLSKNGVKNIDSIFEVMPVDEFEKKNKVLIEGTEETTSVFGKFLSELSSTSLNINGIKELAESFNKVAESIGKIEEALSKVDFNNLVVTGKKVTKDLSKQATYDQAKQLLSDKGDEINKSVVAEAEKQGKVLSVSTKALTNGLIESKVLIQDNENKFKEFTYETADGMKFLTSGFNDADIAGKRFVKTLEKIANTEKNINDNTSYLQHSLTPGSSEWKDIVELAQSKIGSDFSDFGDIQKITRQDRKDTATGKLLESYLIETSSGSSITVGLDEQLVTIKERVVDIRKAISDYDNAINEYIRANDKLKRDPKNKFLKQQRDVAKDHVDASKTIIDSLRDMGLVEQNKLLDEAEKKYEAYTSNLRSVATATGNNTRVVNEYTAAFNELQKVLLNDQSDSNSILEKASALVEKKSKLEKLVESGRITRTEFNEIIKVESKLDSQTLDLINRQDELSKVLKDTTSAEKLQTNVKTIEGKFHDLGLTFEEAQQQTSELRKYLEIVLNEDGSRNILDQTNALNAFNLEQERLNNILKQRKVLSNNSLGVNTVSELTDIQNQLNPETTNLKFDKYVNKYTELSNVIVEIEDVVKQAGAASGKELDVLEHKASGLLSTADELITSLRKMERSNSIDAITKATDNVLDSLEKNKGKFGGIYDELLQETKDAINGLLRSFNGTEEWESIYKRIEKLQSGFLKTIKSGGGTILGQIGRDDFKNYAQNYIDTNYAKVIKELSGSESVDSNGLVTYKARVRDVTGAVEDLTFKWNSHSKDVVLDIKGIKTEATGIVGVIQEIANKTKGLLTYWTATKFDPYDIINYFRQGIGIVQQYDDALTEMRKVSDDSVSSLRNFQQASFDIANQVGTTGLQLQQSTADWLRLGESMEEAVKSAETTSVLFNVSEFDNINTATDAMVSMSQAYKDIEKIDLVNRLNVVGNNFAISTAGLAEALQDSASALAVAGNDIDKSIALLTSANRVVQSPAEVGKGLRTIALRLTGTKVAVQELQD